MRGCNIMWNVFFISSALTILASSLFLMKNLIISHIIKKSRLMSFHVHENSGINCANANGSKMSAGDNDNVVKSYLIGSMVLLGFETINLSLESMSLMYDHAFFIDVCYLSTQICCIFLAMEFRYFCQILQTVAKKMLSSKESPLHGEPKPFLTKSVIFCHTIVKIVPLCLTCLVVIFGGLSYLKFTLDFKLDEAFVLWNFFYLKLPINLTNSFHIFITKFSYNGFFRNINFSFFIMYIYVASIVRLNILFALADLFSGFIQLLSYRSAQENLIRSQRKPVMDNGCGGMGDLQLPKDLNGGAIIRRQYLGCPNQNVNFEEYSTEF